MPRKNTLLIYKIIDSVDMADTITSAVTNIQFLDNIAIQASWSGTPNGVFEVQASLDYDVKTNNQGTWTPLSISPQPSATGAPGNWLLDLNQLSFPFIRLVYTPSSSTGTLIAVISGKEV